jgi:3-oxoacyl-[acyl-carrier protein] reductase
MTSRRTAIVMAASRGLGRASAEALAMGGHDLVLLARDAGRLAEAATDLRRYGGTVDTCEVDVADEAALERAVGATVAERGVDVLVANAGGPPPGGFADTDDTAWRVAFDLVVMSVVRATRLVLPAMRARGRGRVVVIGSSSVVSPLPSLVLSNALRPALAGLVASLAQEVARDGVTANLVAPGRFDTDRVRGLDERRAAAAGTSLVDFQRRTQEGIPIGRYGRAEELGAVVAFLASDAASYLTGQSILLDGGLVPHVG